MGRLATVHLNVKDKKFNVLNSQNRVGTTAAMKTSPTLLESRPQTPCRCKGIVLLGAIYNAKMELFQRAERDMTRGNTHP